MQPRRLPEFPGPKDGIRATAPIQLPITILLSRIPKDNFGHVIYPGGVSEADWVQTWLSW
jgi:hypothetical protein